jgi:chromosome segregation ATPase
MARGGHPCRSSSGNALTYPHSERLRASRLHLRARLRRAQERIQGLTEALLDERQRRQDARGEVQRERERRERAERMVEHGHGG